MSAVLKRFERRIAYIQARREYMASKLHPGDASSITQLSATFDLSHATTSRYQKENISPYQPGKKEPVAAAQERLHAYAMKWVRRTLIPPHPSLFSCHLPGLQLAKGAAFESIKAICGAVVFLHTSALLYPTIRFPGTILAHINATDDYWLDRLVYGGLTALAALGIASFYDSAASLIGAYYVRKKLRHELGALPDLMGGDVWDAAELILRSSAEERFFTTAYFQLRDATDHYSHFLDVVLRLDHAGRFSRRIRRLQEKSTLERFQELVSLGNGYHEFITLMGRMRNSILGSYESPELRGNIGHALRLLETFVGSKTN